MTDAHTPDPLSHFSALLAERVQAAAPSLVSLRSRRSRFSGFFWRPGLVVTADESLPEGAEVSAILASGDKRPATLVGRDATTDVALLRIDGVDAPPVTLDPAPPRTGALALAVGAGPTAQLGLVAHAGPAWQSMRGGEIDARLELDVQLRRESEGGLALDAEGRAFGMAVFGPRRRTLVIPSATIVRVAELLERHGRIPRGYLGIALQPVRPDGDRGPAVMVMAVERDGPAAAAGVHQGDVITAWNGTPPARLDELLRDLGPASIGQPIALTLRRGGQTVEVALTVAERPER